MDWHWFIVIRGCYDWSGSLKLLFVLENYIPHIGGVEVVFKNLMEGLVEKGHKVVVVTHRLKGTKKFEVINGVKVHRVDCFNSRYWFTFLSIPLVLKIAKEADIIHTTLYNAALPAKIGAFLLRKPSVIMIPEVLGEHWKNFEIGALSKKIYWLLEKIILKLNFTKYIAISKSTARRMKGISKKKTEVVYCGVDYNFFNLKKYDGRKIRKKYGLGKNFVYFFFGRPGISKGLEYLIKAVPEISKRIPNAKLLAIVSRDLAYDKRYNYIKKLIKKIGIEDKVILVDPVARKELPNYIKAADCVVVPSLTEGFGFCAAEACAMGKPVVASNTTSLPEVVSGKYVLVKPKNSEAIAIGVEMVKKGKTAKSKLKKFLLKDNIKKHIQIYEGLLK